MNLFLYNEVKYINVYYWAYYESLKRNDFDLFHVGKITLFLKILINRTKLSEK